MFIVDRDGRAWQAGVRFKSKRHKQPSTAGEWFRKGLELYDGGLLDDALLCFDKAKRLGHERAEQTIGICKNHGADFPATVQP
jgi:hypothetical protein